MINTCAKATGGGWFPKNTFRSTGMAFGTVISLLSPPVEANIGTTGSRLIESALERQLYDPFLPRLRTVANVNVDLQRTVGEDLVQIRTFLKVGVSELATIFDVSRQAIYNWLAGENPIPSHAAKIKDLAAAADVIGAERIKITGNVLKRKIKDGKSLLEIIRHGGSAKEGAQILAGMLRRESEQRRMLDLRLANRAKPPINTLDIGLPVFNEQA